MEWTILAFAFLAEAGPHLWTPEGWKAELALGGWLHNEIKIRHWELNLDMVTHLSTDQAQHRLTLLIETNALPLHQTMLIAKVVKAVCLPVFFICLLNN